MGVLGSGRPVAAADFDADGHPDLVVLRNARVEISYGRGGVFGGFGDRQWWASAGNHDQGSAAAVDLDQDGDLDLVTAAGAAFVLENLGGRSFQVRPLPPTPRLIYWELLVAEDLDDDGLTDVLVGPVEGPGFAFHRGLGGMAFADAVVQRSTLVLEAADVDADGDVDVAGPALFRNASRGWDSGERVQYGAGGPGSGGFAPQLGATGPFRVGGTVTTTVRGARGGTVGAWLWSAQRSDLPNTPLPGIRHYASPVLLAVTVPFGGAPGQPGEGAFELSYTVPPAALGVTLRQQFHLLDPAMPSGIGYTNGLEIRFGR